MVEMPGDLQGVRAVHLSALADDELVPGLKSSEGDPVAGDGGHRGPSGRVLHDPAPGEPLLHQPGHGAAGGAARVSIVSSNWRLRGAAGPRNGLNA